VIAVDTVAACRAACDDVRARGGTVGLVPTMGFFHEGHRSLMRAARAEHDAVVVSLFVNPTQFGLSEDLDAYPRDLAGDTEVAAAEDVDVLFAPSVGEMYPNGAATTVHVAGLTDALCGASRPATSDMGARRGSEPSGFSTVSYAIPVVPAARSALATSG